jgi:PBP1b-binding outer membrane lipoprotein LpoB
MKPINMKAIVCPIIVVAGALLLQGCATSGKPKPSLTADDARAYLEVLRSDFNTTKIHTLNQVMKLTVAEAEKFWPIYRNYEKELAAVGDRKLALIVEFMRHHKAGTLNDQNSQEMAAQWLQNAQDRLDLWKKYHQQISDAVSPIRAAQFLQVENQMAIFVDLNIASEMPVIGTPAERKP